MPVRSRMLFSVSALAACCILALSLAAMADEKPSWEHYKSLFISGDGRVIDYGQNQISTSEGQGYGMLLSVINDDRKTFERVWAWTMSNLSVRKDGLMAWSWGRRANDAWEVMDYNNATDGDTLIAFALFRAAGKWDMDAYRREAVSIARSMREKLGVRRGGKTYLLPGYHGFANSASITLNPSYLILPAFRVFSEEEDRTFWRAVHRDSLELLRKSCFGSLCLPADWIRIGSSGIEINGQMSSRFGYDAIRVLLHMSWEGVPMPKGLGHVLDLYREKGYLPRWVDLESNEVSKSDSHAGIYAVYALAAGKAGDHRTERKLLEEADKRIRKEDRNYYSYSLYLLSRTEGMH